MFKTHRPAFLEIPEEFESMRDGLLGHINVFKHRVDLLYDEVRPVQSVLYRRGTTSKPFAAAEISLMLAEKGIKLATTEWAAPIVFAPEKSGSVRFCVDYRTLNAVAICNSYPL